MSTRGGTSGIGINAFRCGGILLDGGPFRTRAERVVRTVPLRDQGRSAAASHARRLPGDLGIALFIPSRQRGLSGQDELDFMLANTPIPLEEVQSTSHIILMPLLPALRELDLETFGYCVSALQDVGWKRRHWTRPDIEPLQSIRFAFDATAGIHGCGLSSTGATVFGFFDSTKVSDDELTAGLRRELSDQRAVPGRVVCTRANNSGMHLTPVA